MPTENKTPSRVYKYYLLCFVIILALIFAFFLPILNLYDVSTKVNAIALFGNALIIFIIAITILDATFLIVKRINYIPLSFLSMTLSISLFLLLEYCFLTDQIDFLYIWNHSKISQPLIYKIVAIWAGQSGSIMTWMVLNSIILFFYRIKNNDKRDHVFILSCIIGLVVLTVFLFNLYSLDPFSLEKHPLFPSFPEGSGLSEILLSPFMIWHPFFTFVAYAIFLIPFSVVIAEVLLGIINKYFQRFRNELSVELKNTYQGTFNDFALKFGWLVSTLSIGLGAYWANIALNWGRYWGWDPVETVSLVPWFFITAYFHTIIFKKKNPILIKINVSLIFLSVLFSTLITRTGNLSPLHSFAGGAELLIWVVVVGLILVCLSLYVIYIVLDYSMEEYRKKKLFLDYLSYIFLFGLAFVCIFGLFIPPFTSYLSNYFPIDTIYIGPEYFIITTLILAVGLAITLTFCSLWEYFKIKWIALAIVVGVSILSVFSFSLLFTLGIWINPLLIIFFMSILASLFKLTNNFNVKKGFKYFFRLNSKTLIHVGISFILVGFLIDPNIDLFQDIFFITGFIFLILGIVPSILTVFFTKGESQ